MAHLVQCPLCNRVMSQNVYNMMWGCTCGFSVSDFLVRNYEDWRERIRSAHRKEDGVEARECDHCGKMFMPKYEWSRECMACFFSSPKGKEWAERKKAESDGWDRTQRDRFKEGFGRTWQGQSPPRREASGGGVTVDALLLRKLLQLCHPDKHGGSELANNVTKTLLEMKGRLG